MRSHVVEHIMLAWLQGDGRQGYADSAPYHAIHVGAAAPQVSLATLSVCLCVSVSSLVCACVILPVLCVQANRTQVIQIAAA